MSMTRPGRESENKISTMRHLTLKSSHALYLVGFLSILSFLAVAESTAIDWTCNVTQPMSANPNFQGNLKSLLQILVNRSRDQFAAIAYGESQEDRAFALFQCFGGVSAYDCNLCYREAKYFVEQTCPTAVGATVWSNWCFLRYETFDFISKLEAYDYRRLAKPPCTGSGRRRNINRKKSVAISQKLMADLSAKASETDNLFAAKSVRALFLKMRAEIKGHAQCWRDLSRDDCRKCLSKGMEEIDKYCDNEKAWRALFLSNNCILTYTIMLAPVSSSSSSSAASAGGGTFLSVLSVCKSPVRFKGPNSSTR